MYQRNTGSGQEAAFKQALAALDAEVAVRLPEDERIAPQLAHLGCGPRHLPRAGAVFETVLGEFLQTRAVDMARWRGAGRDDHVDQLCADVAGATRQSAFEAFRSSSLALEVDVLLVGLEAVFERGPRTARGSSPPARGLCATWRPSTWRCRLLAVPGTLVAVSGGDFMSWCCAAHRLWMGRRPDAWRRVSSRDHDVWDRVLTASDELRRNRVAVWPDTGNSSEAALRVSLTTWGQPDLENLVLTWLPDSGAAYRQLALRLGLEVVGSLGSAPRTT